MTKANWNWRKHLSAEDIATLAALTEERDRLRDRFDDIDDVEAAIEAVATKRAKAAKDKILPFVL